jgi:hypothetical protein
MKLNLNIMKILIAVAIICLIPDQIVKSQHINKDLMGDWWSIDICGECQVDLKYPYQEISFNDSLVIFYSFCYPGGTGEFKVKSSDNISYTVLTQEGDYTATFQKKDESTLIITGICLDTNSEMSWILKKIDKKEYTLSDYLTDKDLDKYAIQAQERFTKIQLE